MSTGNIAWLEHVMDCCLPASPVSPAAHLSAAISSSSDGGEDRISALPDTLLRNVVSRLPVKDAARTAALSHRWRGIWRATPLALDDAHLLRSPAAPAAPAAALVSRVLASHPGPFRAVRIAETPVDGSSEDDFLALAEWFRQLADKGVEELTLVNRPYSVDVPVQLPATLLRCGASLRRLYLGVWLFPFTTGLPRGPDVFPNLQELGLCHGITEERDLEYVLACSPKLETLALISNSGFPERVRVGSRSLRCVLLWHSLADEVAAVSAPNLQRLIIYCTHPSKDDGVIKVKIGHAPQLAVLGYLDTATHQLEIGNTIIKAGATNVCPNTVVPSVNVLALKVRFRVPKEVRTLLRFLRCFPGVETLHIMASDNDTDHYDDPGEVKPSDKLKPTFWQGVGPIKCVKSRVKKLVFDQFNGGTNQVEFLKLVLGRAVLLQKVIVLLAGQDSNSTRDATSKLQPLASKRMWATKISDRSLEVRGRAAGPVWRYDEASDLSMIDPFIC